MPKNLTTDNYIERHGDELLHNGYEVLRGVRLKALKASLTSISSGHEMDFMTKTTILGVFDFRAFLNLAMLVAYQKLTFKTVDKDDAESKKQGNYIL